MPVCHPWAAIVPCSTETGITPKTDLKAADLGLDNSYKRVTDEHRPQISHYIDEQVGIEYNVDEVSGLVGLIKYMPSGGDKNLRCPARANNASKHSVEVNL